VPTIYKRTWAVDAGSIILTSDTAAPQAYDAVTGTKGVSFGTREPYLTALAAAGGILYALDALGILYAFRTTGGTEIWRKQLLSSDDPPGTGLTIDNGGIYLGTVSGTLYKVDAASGRLRWTYHPGSGMESGVAVAGGLVYLRDNNGTLHAISAASGSRAWTHAATAAGLYGLTVAGGRAYYSTDLALQALDATSGAPVWAFTTPERAALPSTPAVGNGLVFIGSYDDGLYAIQA
jgi:outer membrane protein assembly factor BamB